VQQKFISRLKVVGMCVESAECGEVCTHTNRQISMEDVRVPADHQQQVHQTEGCVENTVLKYRKISQ